MEKINNTENNEEALIDAEAQKAVEAAADDKPEVEEKEEAETEEVEAEAPKEETKEEKPAPKEVEGETPREKALRLEVERLKSERREERKKDLLGETKDVNLAQPTDLSPEKKKLLEKYSPEDIARFEEVFEVIAEKKGFVDKNQFHKATYENTANSVFNQFMDEHPEYSEEKDPDGTMWKQLKNEFGMYKMPTNPTDIRKVLNRAHATVFGVKPASDLKEIKAKTEKIKVASHSGATPKEKVVSSSNKTLDPSLKGAMKGFTDEELSELFGE